MQNARCEMQALTGVLTLCILNICILNLHLTYDLLYGAVDVAAGAGCGTRRILNCSLFTTACTSVENL